MGTHSIHPELLRRRVRVLVVGCGATGSAVAGGLPHLHQALIAYGHPEGLHVTVMDGDLISPTNCVRQPFSRFESGHYKALVLVNRLNLFWNLGWEALPEHLTGKEPLDRIDVVIGCVDTRASRAVIRDRTSGSSTVAYVLDIGNTSDSGQSILGEPLNQVNRRSRTRLRSVFELYPLWFRNHNGYYAVSKICSLITTRPDPVRARRIRRPHNLSKGTKESHQR